MSETDATPPDDPGDQSSPVTNALLGYVFNCMHFSSVYNLRAVVLGHFSADAIHKAKETLAQHVASSVVGEAFFTTRRGSSARGKAKARTGKAKEKEEMELDDIIEAMEAMDKAGVSVEFHIPAFELHLLPRTRPEDLLSVTFMENVKRLEARVAALDTHAALSTEQMSILKQKVDHLETTAHASGSSCVSPETIPMSPMHFPSLNAINSAGTITNRADGEEPDPNDFQPPGIRDLTRGGSGANWELMGSSGRLYDSTPMFSTIAFLGMALVLVYIINHIYKGKHRPRRKRGRLKKMPTIFSGVKMPGV
ncbi:hypothetical protein CAPTEDRAFT_207115 [Capitella teleta]|uniref:Uncharacterized protein n=3 Tax=Capitella teleta TaxID=283909 RepID=R7T9V8_CAPTE|nr:hypothetical protein CAPTEDRAFT_207115 [Capitella teleta]|eukprot:ELT90538.1 hypothetical protein CAPTEDRAFT_207115 [Capitella teleta]